MSRWGIFHFVVGFSILLFAAAAGSFVAYDATQLYGSQANAMVPWQLLLQKSAHGHSSLLAMVHVLYGLTLPYTRPKPPVLLFQSLGLCLGSLAMGVGLIVRSYAPPSVTPTWGDWILAALLASFLLALLSHLWGLICRLVNFQRHSS